MLRELHHLPPDIRVGPVLDRGRPPHRGRHTGDPRQLSDPSRSGQKQENKFSSTAHRSVGDRHPSGN